MKNSIANAALGLSLLMLTAGSAFAFELPGCVDSPENPTLMLALLGALAAGLPKLKARLRRRRLVP